MATSKAPLRPAPLAGRHGLSNGFAVDVSDVTGELCCARQTTRDNSPALDPRKPRRRGETMRLKATIATAVCAMAFVGASASAAFAGEVTGPSGSGKPTGAPLHA